MAHEVFISYSSKDKPVADALCATLENNGVRCWIAPRDILPGSDWGESIIRAINDARVFVLVFSQFANTSLQIRREVERAVNRGLPLIPYRIEDVQPTDSLEYFISTPHWLDAFTPPLERHAQYLADTVKRILGDAPPPPPRPAPPPKPRPKARANPAPIIIAVGVAAVLAGGLAYHLRPPNPFGVWTASRIQWAPGAAANFNPVTLGELAGAAMGDGQVTSAFTLTQPDAFRQLTTFEDDGTVTRSGGELVFTSKAGPTAKVNLTAYAAGEGQIAKLGGQGGEAALLLQGNDRYPEPWVGKPDLLASGGPLDRVAGAWRSGTWAPPPTGQVWTGSLTITADGAYQLKLYAAQGGAWTMGDGAWKLVLPSPYPPGSVTATGSYQFTNHNALTTTNALGVTNWVRRG